jgi:hypothetical protein
VFRIRIAFDRLDPDPGEQKTPKIEKMKEISCFEVLDVFF